MVDATAAVGSSQEDTASRTLYQIASDELPVDSLQLVVSARELGESRLLVTDPERKTFAHIVPLQNASHPNQARRYAASDPSNLSLASERIGIFGKFAEMKFNQNPNHFGFNHFGDVTFTTALAGYPLSIKLHDLHERDPLGSGRRLFRCEFAPRPELFRTIEEADGHREPAVEWVLVLHPLEGGWHRLLDQRSGKVRRAIPMHSARLRAWLGLREKLADADPIERDVFQRVSSDIPYFSRFKVKDGHIVGVELYLTATNKHVIRHLVDLPRLESLTLQGESPSGKLLALQR
ncbi:hypothetical protein Pla175_25050 [Pirellulimonas nuda]|uniref:Uncharacterized protein n=1 Tax=Pirellulimonas nuda TaxID=2528009 RepID=A0A518DCC0_9BACT|nr:hypothetical protein [Pirellulimonas nuda]QDU89119.1 hypothetical protein Pla175_25050 [Pirellulimonas nuda]